ncbi:MAG: GNAT family N-acetyltransferase [Planctomycetaceae bacterium]
MPSTRLIATAVENCHTPGLAEAELERLGALFYRERRLSELTTADHSRWDELSQMAVAPNPFQSPAFVLPAVRHLFRDDSRIRLMSVESSRTREWLSAFVVEDVDGSLRKPIRRLRSFETLYSYLSTPLFNRNAAQLAANALFYSLAVDGRWHGLRLKTLGGSSEIVTGTADGEQPAHGTCIVQRTWQRAAIVTQGLQPGAILARCSKSRRKSLNRSYRLLEQAGRVNFRLRRPNAEDTEPMETFLRLEHQGWKLNQKTSLLADPATAAFARSMLSEFARRSQVCYGELSVDDQVIASTCNLLAGETMFAFKIGWDATHQAASPGLWSEILLAEAVSEQLPDVIRIDSCSLADSHLDSIWSDRLTMRNVVCLWSQVATIAANAISGVRTGLKLLSGYQPQLAGTLVANDATT